MALIPPFFVDSVVAIGNPLDDGTVDWIASGFFFGRRMGSGDREGESKYLVYLISNRHVFKRLDGLVLRFNPAASGPAREYRLALHDEAGNPKWFAHPDPDVDVGAIPVAFELLQRDGMRANFFRADRNGATIAKLKEIAVVEGDFLYVLGFPMGLVGERHTVIVRSGIVARIRDLIDGAARDFLLDATVFPGNSGGPVVLKPDAASIVGTPHQQTSYLIGIVKSYVPYQDIAISVQTERPRVIFEENSGLALAHPVDYIEEAVDQHSRTLRGKQTAELETEPPPEITSST